MNMRKFALGLMILVGLVVSAEPSSPAVDLTGTWTGSLALGNGQGPTDEITLVLRKADKSYAGTINDSLGIIDKDSAITGVNLAGNALGFDFKAMGGSMEFAMNLTASGDKMTGEVTNKATGQGMPFEFIRKK